MRVLVEARPGTAGRRGGREGDSRGSKYPIFEDPGPKSHTVSLTFGTRVLEILGTWTLQEIVRVGSKGASGLRFGRDLAGLLLKQYRAISGLH